MGILQVLAFFLEYREGRGEGGFWVGKFLSSTTGRK